MKVVARGNNEAALDLAKAVVKKLERQGIDEERAGRAIVLSVLRMVASRIGFRLPFKDSQLEALATMEPHISTESVMQNPSILDILYETFVPQKYRKRYGQFITPPPISRFMVSWGLGAGCTKILDPAVGTGVFLADALQSSSASVCGIDVDTLALNTCALRLKLANPQVSPELVEANFLLSESMRGDFDFIVCNPPYLNFHDFDRNSIIRSVEERANLKLSRLSNIYPLFFFRSYPLLRDGGRMAFITPSEYFYTGYGERLKSFLLEKFTVEALILTDFAKLAFADALTTSVITLLQKSKPADNHKIRLVRVSEWPNVSDLLDLVKRARVSLQGCAVFEVHQKDLDPCKKWQIYFVENSLRGTLSKLVPLSRVATVNRGVATGANSYFALNTQEVRKWKIEERFLRPVISRATHAPNYDYTLEDLEYLRRKGEKTFLLYCFEEPSSNLSKYLDYGKKHGVHNRYLPSHRTPWYSSEKQEPAPILATVFSRKRMRFVYNEANVLTLTAYHCIYPYSSDVQTIKALLAYLNSSLCANIQESMRREYGGGLHKFEPKDLEDLLVLNVMQISDDRRAVLARLFDELRKTARDRPSRELEIRAKMDKELHSVLGSQ